MYEWNLFLNILLSIVMVVSSALSLPLNSLLFRIDTPASVFESGDDMYTVIWSTSLPGTGCVTYEYEGEEYKVWDEQYAIIRSTDSVHSVRIPKKHLDNNTYTYHSQHVGTKRAYVAVKGRTVSSEPVEFKGYSGQEEIHALVLSDIHENPDNAEKAMKNFDKSADLLIMNGDEVSLMTTERKFKQVLTYAHRFSKGGIPVIYTRGNHENRGEYSIPSVEIFKTTTGGMYYTCNYGPVSFLCLDTGEDKKDTDWTYSGLVDLTTYIGDETAWMESLTPDEDAEYRLAVGHMPNADNRYGYDWTDTLEGLGIDLYVAAHKHRISYEYNKGKFPFYQMIDGGKSRDDDYLATMLTFAQGKIYAECFDQKGNFRGDYTYEIN
jgi:hypothetical protein